MTASHRPVRFVNPPTLPPVVGYTHVVETRGGRTVHVSGQVALDASGNLVGAGDLRAQTRQVFDNLAAALAAVGGSFQHVVKLTFFLLDISQMPVVRAVRDQYIDRENPPASTAVEVRRLVRDDFPIEVDAIAVIPD